MKLQIQNIAGEILREDNLVIEENDILVILPKTHESFKFFVTLSKEEMLDFIRALEEDKMLIIPPDVEIKVIRRK